METAAIKHCEIAFGGKNVNESYILRINFEFLTEDFSKTIRYTQEPNFKRLLILLCSFDL